MKHQSRFQEEVALARETLKVATDLDQLILAVRHQPGARAYALLAERYIAQGEIPAALEVCEAGFATNPAYERGAAAYLAALRSQGDSKLASEVYGRAVAEHPRSSLLRIAWAKVLLDAGREYEARLRTREAVNLDPMNRDARALLATLGGTPPPSRRTTGGIAIMRPATATKEYENPPLRDEDMFENDLDVFGEHSGDTASQAHPQEKETAPPRAPKAALPGRKSPAKRAADSHFDFTPAPVLRRDGAAPLDARADFFDLPEAPTPQPLGPPITVHRTSGASKPPITPPPLPTGLGRPQTRSRSDMTGPHLPSETGRPLPSDAPSQNLFPLSSAPPAGPSLTSPTLPTGDAPPPSTSVAPLATVETGKVAPTPAVRPRRRGVRIVVALVLLGLAGAGGFLLYGRLHRRAVTKAMAQHVARLQSGDPATRSTVRQAICDLAQKETSTPRLAAACALASADLIVLDGKTELIPHAKQDLQRARRRDKADPWTIASFALLSLDDVKTMSVLSTRAAFQGKDWHLMLTRALVLDRLGRPEKAIQVLKKLITSGPAHALSPLLQATRLTRLMGNLKRAQVLIAKAKGLAPKHPGVLIETALLAATKGRAPEASAITTLRKLAAPSHLWRADVDLLEAHAMAIKGRRAEAAKLAEEAVSLAKEARPEAGWAAGRWHLAPGGDVQRAHKLLKRWGPRYEAYKPIAALWRAQSLFALARPRDADRALTELNKIAARIDLQSRQRLVTLQIRIVEGLDDHQRLSALCPATLSIAEGARVVACAEALLPRGKRKPIRRWLHRIRRHQSGSATDRYLTGLLLTARGDTKGALKKLRSVRPTSSIDESRRLSALGDAYIATKSFARGLKILREALKVSAGAARPRVVLAEALVAAGHDTEAREVLDAVVAARPSDPTLLTRAGQAFVTLGQPAPAKALLRQALKVNPTSPTIQLLAAQVALLDGTLPEARKLFRAVLKKEPGHVEAHIALGQIAVQNKHPRAAQKHFAAALQQRPKDPKVLEKLATVFLHLRRWHDAVKHASKAISILKKRGDYKRAVELMITLGRGLIPGNRYARDKAQEILFAASTSAHPPARAFYELGRLHRTLRDHSRAIWSFKQAIKRDKTFANAYLQLGLTQRGKRRWRRQARRNLKRYLALDPKGKHAPQVRALLKR